jgi:hydroxymethylbilane synthase
MLPGARFEPIRGNLDTRLRKLDEGGYDAIVLAAAGLRRLGFSHRISMTLPAEACVPAPGQGIVAVEIRESDEEIGRVVKRISDASADAALDAERAVIDMLGGGCQTPVGALATLVESRESKVAGHESRVELSVIAVVVTLDGSRAVRAHATGDVANARLIGKAVGSQLLAEGAADILAAASASGAVKPPVSSE